MASISSRVESRRSNIVITRKRWLVLFTIPITPTIDQSDFRYIGRTWSSQTTCVPGLHPSDNCRMTLFRLTIDVW